MLSVVALAERSFALEHQVTKRKQSLRMNGSCKLHATQRCRLSIVLKQMRKKKEAGKCREELEDVEKRLEEAQVPANKAHDDGRTAIEDTSKFEVDHDAKVGHTWEMVGELTEQLRQQAASTAAGSGS